jgi:hypothetical protein
MLNDDGSAKGPAESREYRLARAYTERQRRIQERLNTFKLIAWAALIAMPIGYAVPMSFFSDGPAGVWSRATAKVGELFSIPFPALGRVAGQVFGNGSSHALKFLGIAGIDLLCIASACLLLFVFRPGLRPKAGGLQFKFLDDLAKGFRLGKRRNSMRFGGPAGGVVTAFLVIGLILWGLHALFLEPMQNGRFFADVRADCATEPDVPDLERTAETETPDCLHLVIWPLAWKTSLAAALIPLGLLLALNYAVYPLWLAQGRPTRKAENE